MFHRKRMIKRYQVLKGSIGLVDRKMAKASAAG
jgi:hypothetical protein